MPSGVAKSFLLNTICFLGLIVFTHVASAQDAILYPHYIPDPTVEGTVHTVGSDTMAYIAAFWLVEFKRTHPKVKIRIEAGGSATAPPALTDGLSTFGPMSRHMKDNEIQAFVAKYGYPPTELRVAMDALAVYGNKDNPVKGLTIAQVDAIFSSTGKCGYGQDIQQWGQLGLAADWATRPVSLFGRNLLSGTRLFFMEHALCDGKYKETLTMVSSSANVVHEVGNNLGAIGYSGMGYKTEAVKIFPLAEKSGEPFVEATAENVWNGTYPLLRFLYVNVNKPPGKPLPPLQAEFLRMVLSDVGQHFVEIDGFVPLNATILNEELAKIQ